ncbi:MAG: hypothetical protein R8F63_04950 [Acidimicrobiales bacterium]|nr:hypothetical protein [Acidimicrobiales bacterium]
MVALRTIPLGSPGLPTSIRDDDLVIALDPAASLDGAGAAALVEAASGHPADAFFGDVVLAGERHRRPAWSPTRLRSDPVAASPIAVRAGWLRARNRGGIDPALVFTLAEDGARVAHLPAVLTHHPGPLTAPDPAAVAAHCERIGVPAAEGLRPRVDVIVPSAGQSLPGGTIAVTAMLESLPPTDGIRFLLVVGEEFAANRSVLDRPDVTVLERGPGAFNFSAAINIGLLRASADLVLLLNDDTEQAAAGSIPRMAAQLADPGVAAVGALLTYPDGTVQHDGIVIDDARPLHPFVGWEVADTAPHGGLLAREVVAVTGACLLARRRDLLAVGGLSTGFPLSFNDVDLCVRLQRSVGRVVIEPAARFVHHETLSREPVIAAEEWDRWIDRWGEIEDPWYHPGFRRPDDPHALHHNADHLDPGEEPPASALRLREPVLRSRVHRARVPSPPD